MNPQCGPSPLNIGFQCSTLVLNIGVCYAAMESYRVVHYGGRWGRWTSGGAWCYWKTWHLCHGQDGSPIGEATPLLGQRPESGPSVSATSSSAVHLSDARMGFPSPSRGWSHKDYQCAGFFQHHPALSSVGPPGWTDPVARLEVRRRQATVSTSTLLNGMRNGGGSRPGITCKCQSLFISFSLMLG